MPPPIHEWTCVKRGAPRKWDPLSASRCLLCRTLEAPVKGEASDISISIDTPTGVENWILTCKDSKPAWLRLGSDMGTSGPKSDLAEPPQDSSTTSSANVETQLKLSVAEPIDTMAVEAPVQGNTQAPQFSDFVSSDHRQSAKEACAVVYD